MESMLYELDKPLILKDVNRKKLQRVYGKLIDEKQLRKITGDFISVGDVVTHTLLKMGIFPKIAIVDYKTKRGKVIYEDVKKFKANKIRVKNPPGTITPELWNAVRNAIFTKERTKIEVDGEEDLAIIPVVFFAPLGANVIYGIPNMGLILLKIAQKDKNEVKKIIKDMEV